MKHIKLIPSGVALKMVVAITLENKSFRLKVLNRFCLLCYKFASSMPNAKQMINWIWSIHWAIICYYLTINNNTNFINPWIIIGALSCSCTNAWSYFTNTSSRLWGECYLHHGYTTSQGEYPLMSMIHLMKSNKFKWRQW